MGAEEDRNRWPEEREDNAKGTHARMLAAAHQKL